MRIFLGKNKTTTVTYKYNDLPDENTLYTYTLLSPGRTKSGGIEICIKKYRYIDTQYKRIYVPEERNTCASYWLWDNKDSEKPSHNMIRFFGKLQYKRALEMFLKEKKEKLKNLQETKPELIRDLDYAYIDWLERELKRIEEY